MTRYKSWVLTDVTGDLWIGYDSPRALRRKLEYARDLGLGGVMFWEASTDVRGDGTDSLIRVASETLAQPSTWQEWTERWWSPEERLNPQLVGEEADLQPAGRGDALHGPADRVLGHLVAHREAFDGL